MENKSLTTILPEALRISIEYPIFPVLPANLLSPKRETQMGFKKHALNYSTHMQVYGKFHFYSSTFSNFNADIFSLFWI